MKHVMVDIECLGNKPASVILSIGAVRFHPDYCEFYRRIDIGSSLLAGLTVSEDTTNWWKEQDKAAIEAAFYCKGGVRVHTAFADFAEFVDKDTLVWAKGPDYDCVMLASVYEKLGMKLPWSFRNNRDVRTILALSGVKQHKVGAHDALNDARNQAAAVIESYRVLGLSEAV